MDQDVSPDTSIDPVTRRPWPQWLDTLQTARLGKEVYGLPVEPKTLANQRVVGRGPAWRYYGQKPLCNLAEAHRYFREMALSDESPLTRRARERTERVMRDGMLPPAA